MIPAQLLTTYEENRLTSSRDDLRLEDASRRVSRKAYAVFGEVSWWSSVKFHVIKLGLKSGRDEAVPAAP